MAGHCCNKILESKLPPIGSPGGGGHNNASVVRRSLRIASQHARETSTATTSRDPRRVVSSRVRSRPPCAGVLPSRRGKGSSFRAVHDDVTENEGLTAQASQPTPGSSRPSTDESTHLLGRIRECHVSLSRIDSQRVPTGGSPVPPVPIRHPPRTPAIEGPGAQRDVRILRLNMSRSIAVTREVFQLVHKERLDILLVQEPYAIREANTWAIRGLGLGMRIAACSTERPWAAVVACNSIVEIAYVSQLSTAHCICAEARVPGGSFFVVSSYFQYSDDIEIHLRHLEKVLSCLRCRHILVAADANAQHSLWSPRSTDCGVLLGALIESFGLRVANDVRQGPTFGGAAGTSFIDVTLATPAIRSSSQRVNNSGVCEGATMRFNVRRADWEKFEATLDEEAREKLADHPLDSSADVERRAEVLRDVLTNACRREMLT
ncbi:uncharacterized protein LOC135172609 [Diachasmimorpha longicaudata]|uniref:uncharacterized protein LOC135172609 n=1 Tax=Diachasmimorpha longicaudata TaxID=58733 RepID=UPI0030B9008C